MEKQKAVLPGEFIASEEEAIAGNNTFSENNEIYSSMLGEVSQQERKIEVKSERHIAEPAVGMKVYCIVRKTSATKAFLDCTPAADLERPGSGIGISAVLPVQNVKRDYVRSLQDEVRVGDLLKGKISKIVRDSADVSIQEPEYGIVKAFCTSCRNEMVLKKGALICSNCERKETRKLSEEYPSGE